MAARKKAAAKKTRSEAYRLVEMGLLGEPSPEGGPQVKRLWFMGQQARKRSILIDHVEPTADNVDQVMAKYLPAVV
jgi:hypothetical protein